MQEIITQARELALEEIKKFGVPKLEHFNLANEKGQELAQELSADRDIVALGTILMDLKIGECRQQGRLAEHVKESSLTAQEFLKKFKLEPEIFKKVVSCIESHHGVDNYYCLEAEICANADCYRFLSPVGFFHGFMIFAARGLSFEDLLSQLDNKLDEKYKILSLNTCRHELEDYYWNFKKLIKDARGG